jgi:hypothetical protein
MALEIKTPRDDLTRGLGQLTEALAYGYDKAALVTTASKAKKINRKVFHKMGFDRPVSLSILQKRPPRER